MFRYGSLQTIVEGVWRVNILYFNIFQAYRGLPMSNQAYRYAYRGHALEVTAKHKHMPDGSTLFLVARPRWENPSHRRVSDERGAEVPVAYTV